MEQLREAEAWAPQLLALLALSASSCTLRAKVRPKPGSGVSGAKTYFPKKDFVWGKKIIVSFPYKSTSDPHIFFVLGRFRNFPGLVVLPCNAPRHFARQLANGAPDGDVVVGFLVRLAAGFPTRPASSPPQHRGPLRRRFSFRYRVATG